MKVRSIYALVTFLPVLALACGGSSPSGEGGSGGSGAAGGASPTTSSGAGTSTGACVHASDYQCAQITGTSSEAEQWKAVCTASGDMATDGCPTMGLIGCCKTATSSTCFYTGIDMDEATLMQACGPQMATWSTTP